MDAPVQEERSRQNLPTLIVLNPRVPGRVGIFFGGADEGRHTVLRLSVDRRSLLVVGFNDLSRTGEQDEAVKAGQRDSQGERKPVAASGAGGSRGAEGPTMVLAGGVLLFPTSLSKESMPQRSVL